MDLFRDRGFSFYSVVIFAAQFGKISVIVFGAHYLQDKLDMSPLIAGLAIMVSVIMAPFLAGPSGVLTDRFGARPLVLRRCCHRPWGCCGRPLRQERKATR